MAAEIRASDGTFGTYVQIDPQKLAELLRGPQGPVVRLLLDDGEKVKREAVRTCPVYRPTDAASAQRRKRKPGTLRDSIVKRLAENHDGVAVLVGSDDPVALYVHEGTRPHTITAKRAPALVFVSRRTGRIVRVPKPHSVNHPGTKRQPWLAESLRVLRH